MRKDEEAEELIKIFVTSIKTAGLIKEETLKKRITNNEQRVTNDELRNSFYFII